MPFLASWPGRVPAGRTTDHVAAFWDLLPTLCDLVGIDRPSGIDGVSYLPTLLGEPGQQQPEELYWELLEQGGRQALRLGDWKAVRYDLQRDPLGAIQLYDLNRDPGEKDNLATSHPDLVARAAARFAAIAREHPEPRPFDARLRVQR